ncbi:MAG TPA: CTP synthase, partial [Actinomycetota bacterium]|nr:CTP synthase [Actinomycetota bacterium]
HITDEIKSRIRGIGHETDADVVIVEVGGTVGDIESLPFLEAIRQLRNEVGRDRCAFVHLSLLPRIAPTGELKTKPTQHSVKELRGLGISPDAIVCRADEQISPALKQKISLLCDVDLDAVISEVDAERTIYDVPTMLHEEGLDDYIARILQLDHGFDFGEWQALLDRIDAATEPVTIAVVGKYVDLPDAYLSVIEALNHGGYHHGAKIDVRWVASDQLRDGDVDALLGDVDGILVPGGFGVRGVEGKVDAIRYARERRVPFLGICLGLQCAVIEFARNGVGLRDANSSEFEPTCEHPVIDLLPEQKDVTDLGGSMRLGAQPCHLVAGTQSLEAYGERIVFERHRHRYEVNPAYRLSLEEHGLIVAGTSPDGRLVEVIELADHPFFVATQFHPELKSRPTRPHPLYRDFVGAAFARRRAPEAAAAFR